MRVVNMGLGALLLMWPMAAAMARDLPDLRIAPVQAGQTPNEDVPALPQALTPVVAQPVQVPVPQPDQGPPPAQLSAADRVTPPGPEPTALPTVASSPLAHSRVWALKTTDERIEIALRRWCAEAGVNLLWDADRHFLVEVPTELSGPFESVVRQLLSSPAIANSSYPLEACLYANVPPVLRVTRLGDHTPDCKAKP